MIFRVRCMLMPRCFYDPDQKEKKKVERNVAVKWVMLFIYGTGHFVQPPSPSRPPSLSYTHIHTHTRTQGVIRAQHNC